MHDIKSIRENPEAFDRGLKRRGLPGVAEQLIKMDEHRRTIVRVLESWRARRKTASEKIHQAKKAGNENLAQELMSEVAECKTSISTLEAEEKVADEQIAKALAEIPNLPLDEVPDGVDEKGNVEHHKFGAPRTFSFTTKQHFDLGTALGQMDFETATKLSGARFVVLKSGLARMERALGQFMLDVHVNDHGYTEVNPPILVRDEAMFGTAQLPKFEQDQFYGANSLLNHFEILKANKETFEVKLENTRKLLEILRRWTKEGRFQNYDSSSDIANAEKEEFEFSEVVNSYNREVERVEKLSSGIAKNLWLIPTAEVPLTNLVREAITDEAELPMRLTACTPCFRAEAGAAGKDTRGMIRQHQFTKVELVSITTPDESMKEHERMLNCAEEVLRRLELPYRVITLCTGDMGFASQKTYDIEVWLPGQNMYREISSCSVCGDFQARRMNARYRPKGGNPRFVHTLNGSGVAVGRALIAVMENYQNEDGSISVPDKLLPYMGGIKRIEKTK